MMKIESAPKLKITPIKNGTVIDHITQGNAMVILRILGLPEVGKSSVISIALNVSGETGKKDILKIEDEELVEKISCEIEHHITQEVKDSFRSFILKYHK